LVHAVASEDPTTAASWIEKQSLPLPGQMRFREAAIDTVVKQWAQLDTDALLQWAKSLESGSLHADMAYASLSEVFGSMDSAAADHWASKISNEELRMRRSGGF